MKLTLLTSLLLTTIASVSSASSKYTIEQSQPFAEQCAKKHNVGSTYEWKQGFYKQVDNDFRVPIRWETKDFLGNIKVNYETCYFSRSNGASKSVVPLTIWSLDHVWNKTLLGSYPQLDPTRKAEEEARIKAEQIAFQVKQAKREADRKAALEAAYYESEPTYDNRTAMYHGKDENGNYIRIYDPTGYKWLTKVINDGIREAWITIRTDHTNKTRIDNRNGHFSNATSINGVNEVKLYTSHYPLYSDGIHKAINALKRGDHIWLHLQSAKFRYSTNHQKDAP